MHTLASLVLALFVGLMASFWVKNKTIFAVIFILYMFFSLFLALGVFGWLPTVSW